MRKTILCVDDYHSWLVSMTAIVGSWGYHVLGTTKPIHAVLIATTGNDVDLVITDFVMPTMSGREVITAIRERKPDIPIILLTGMPWYAELNSYGANAAMHKDGWIGRLPGCLDKLLKECASGKRRGPTTARATGTRQRRAQA